MVFKTILAVCVVLTTLLVIFMGVALTTTYLKVNSVSNNVLPSVIVVNHDLTSEQMAISEELVNQVDPLYFNHINKIIFTNNVTKECMENRDCTSCSSDNCLGQNYGSVIAVGWIEPHDNREAVKETLCHELLHGFIRAGIPATELHHQVIYDMADKGVCYK